MDGQKVLRGVLYVGCTPASMYLRQTLLQTGTAATAGTDGGQDGGTRTNAFTKLQLVVPFLSYWFPLSMFFMPLFTLHPCRRSVLCWQNISVDCQASSTTNWTVDLCCRGWRWGVPGYLGTLNDQLMLNYSYIFDHLMKSYYNGINHRLHLSPLLPVTITACHHYCLSLLLPVLLLPVTITACH